MTMDALRMAILPIANVASPIDRGTVLRHTAVWRRVRRDEVGERIVKGG